MAVRSIAVSIVLLLALLSTGATQGADIVNAGFEDGWAGWTDGDPTGSGTALSDVANSGERSVKLTENGAYVAQTVAVQPGTTYRLSAYVRGPGNLGTKVGAEMFFEQQPKKGKKWRELSVTFSSGAAESVYVFASCGGMEVRFDDFRLEALGAEEADTSARIISSRAGGYGLSPDLPPGRNFDLLGWYLSTPADDDKDGKSDRISEAELARGDIDERYFFTAEDGGMVFRATVAGAKTSKNTRNTRTELREMLRRGDTSIRTRNDDRSPNKNNWVLSSAPERALKAAGGIDGTLRATLAVNRVTETGDRSHVGRVVIGQIHAAVDEPIRLYYRKMPENKRGSIYAAHEPSGGDDIFYELIGSRRSDAEDPPDGIALGEKFSYGIEARGNFLHVSISKDGELRAEQTIDMSNSGYDVYNDYMYFKAGVYNQNDTGEADDFAQATFYELEASHSE
ncbi:MAG: polysaccharide lyase family 7 protein [Gammaproteobacteria bacterium]|nr:polysaccharide lyase family 7 protein [Gammaproteobacteria bacterium]MBT8094536.1 polysaccharide lyase family 7 protein [Gammaproteobacteria bacterium]